MFDTLFGEGQYGMKMLFAFIVVFGLLALALWLVRRFGSGQLGNAGTRGRQPRLAVIDAATVDGRRRLVLIRRDNVEHLLIIGGPTDVVIEQNIVRAVGAPRDAVPARPPAAADPLPRPVPLGEGTMWPLQPEPAPRAEPAPRIEPLPRAEPAARVQPPPRPEPPLRADGMGRPQRPSPMIEEPMQWSAPEPELPPPPRERRPRPADPLAGLAEELARAPAPSDAPPAEPPMRPIARRERAPRPPPAPPPPSAPAAEAGAEVNSSADQNLAEMAQRLEAALRRPPKEDGRAAAAAPRGPTDEAEYAPPSAPPARAADGARPARAAGARGDARPPPQKSLYDSLEQEMASLLGRPNSKP